MVDDRTIEEVDKKNGKTVATSKTVVSPDGKTATFEFTDSSKLRIVSLLHGLELKHSIAGRD